MKPVIPYPGHAVRRNRLPRPPIATIILLLLVAKIIVDVLRRRRLARLSLSGST